MLSHRRVHLMGIEEEGPRERNRVLLRKTGKTKNHRGREGGRKGGKGGGRGRERKEGRGGRRPIKTSSHAFVFPYLERKLY